MTLHPLTSQAWLATTPRARSPRILPALLVLWLYRRTGRLCPLSTVPATDTPTQTAAVIGGPSIAVTPHWPPPALDQPR